MEQPSADSPLVLVVDDDRKIVETLQRYLERAGFRVVPAHSGAEALATARASDPDLVILDLMLPRGDGIEVCRSLREWSAVPILMLTARTSEEDRIRGLELGADDYVTKPFSPREVVARVRAILRRIDAPSAPDQLLRAGDLTCDPIRHEVRRGDTIIELTPTQFTLLQALMQEPGRVFRRRELADRAPEAGRDIDDRTIDAHIMNLRRKVDDDLTTSRIATVFGVGYRLVRR